MNGPQTMNVYCQNTLTRGILCLVTHLCPTLLTPGTVANQASLSMQLPRQEYWRELPFPIKGVTMLVIQKLGKWSQMSDIRF